MANGGIESSNLGTNEDGNISNWSISKLISSLKSTFRPKDFSRVEAVLLAREDRSKREIEALKREKDSILCQSEKERLEKETLENELEKCKKEREEIRKEVSKLQEENVVLRAREKSAEERCNKLLEEVNRMGDKEKEMVKRIAEKDEEMVKRSAEKLTEILKSLSEKDNEMIDLRGRNCQLECEKTKAEDELKILSRRFEELDKRVLSLESNLSLLGNQEYSKSNEIGRENGNSGNVAVKCDETLRVEEVSFGPSCDSPVKANGDSQNAGSGGTPCENIIEIPDSDDDCAPVETLSEKGMTSLHPANNSNSDQIGVENGSPTPKRKRTSCTNVGESENGDECDNTSTGKSKMKKFQEPVCNPCDFPLNHCSTATISSDSNEVNKGLTSQREDFMVSRQGEQRLESEQKSQNPINGFPLDGLGFMEESSSSSSSDSDDDNDGMHIFFNHSQLEPEARRENRN